MDTLIHAIEVRVEKKRVHIFPDFKRLSSYSSVEGKSCHFINMTKAEILTKRKLKCMLVYYTLFNDVVLNDTRNTDFDLVRQIVYQRFLVDSCIVEKLLSWEQKSTPLLNHKINGQN